MSPCMTRAQPRNMVAFATPTADPCRASSGRTALTESSYFLRLTADLVQFCCKPQRLGKRGGVIKITRKPKACLQLPDRLVRITHYCGDKGVDNVTADARIMAPYCRACSPCVSRR